jgi:hypothetical protein
MQQRLFLGFRIFGLLLILPLFSIAFAPPTNTKADCTTETTSSIRVSNGLVSAIDTDVTIDVNNKCVTGTAASIPQVSLPTYASMFKDYYEQAKSSYGYMKVTPYTTSQIQTTATSIINLSGR